MDQIELDKLVGLTLLEALMLIPDDEVIHIGSGTGFLFVGTKESFARDEDVIYADCIKAARKNTQLCLKQIQEQTEKIGKRRTKLEDLRKIAEEISECCKKLGEYTENFIPLSRRSVLDAYPRQLNDGVILLISGTESGKYWDKTEYDKECK